MNERPIGVHHEWGRLREVVVGCSHTRIGRALPRVCRNYMSPTSFDMAQALSRDHAGKSLAEVRPEMHARAESQMQAATALLERRGIVVHRTATMDEAEEEYLNHLALGSAIQYFARDPILVIGDTIIETAMFLPMRRRERFPIRRTIGSRIRGRARVVALPEPVPLPEKDGEEPYGPGPFLEGGDVFLLGRDIYVGNTGNGSNTAGVRWLGELLGPSYRVHEIRLSRRFLHLDCVLATPRPGLAIVCREGFVDGVPEFLRGWKLIEVSVHDAEERLAANVLVLDEQTALVAEELPELGEALARAGQDVITTPFSAVYAWGGAFRCWHHPLIRESELV